jgi:hypothetical protein
MLIAALVITHRFAVRNLLRPTKVPAKAKLHHGQSPFDSDMDRMHVDCLLIVTHRFAVRNLLRPTKVPAKACRATQ